jgi:hypothetical protein
VVTDMGTRFALFRTNFRILPSLFLGHFHFGKYVDSVMQSRVTAMASRRFDQESLLGVDENVLRTKVTILDKTCQKYILLAMTHYATALKLDSKHVYQALPRLLSLWFEINSIRHDQHGLDGDPMKEYSGKDCSNESSAVHMIESGILTLISVFANFQQCWPEAKMMRTRSWPAI